MTASAPPEQTQTASPARAASEGHSTSSASMADGSDDAVRFEAVPRDSTTPLHLRLLKFLALDAKGGESCEYES